MRIIVLASFAMVLPALALAQLLDAPGDVERWLDEAASSARAIEVRAEDDIGQALSLKGELLAAAAAGYARIDEREKYLAALKDATLCAFASSDPFWRGIIQVEAVRARAAAGEWPEAQRLLDHITTPELMAWGYQVLADEHHYRNDRDAYARETAHATQMLARCERAAGDDIAAWSGWSWTWWFIVAGQIEARDPGRAKETVALIRDPEARAHGLTMLALDAKERGDAEAAQAFLREAETAGAEVLKLAAEREDYDGNPDSVWSSLAVARAGLGDVENAEAALAAIEKPATRACVHAALAVQAAKAGDAAAAQARVHQAIEELGNEPDVVGSSWSFWDVAAHIVEAGRIQDVAAWVEPKTDAVQRASLAIGIAEALLAQREAQAQPQATP